MSLARLLVAFWRGASPARRRQFFLLTFFIVICGLIELMALGCLALFITSLTSPEEVMQSRYLAMAGNILGSDVLMSRKGFYLTLGVMTLVLVLAKNIFTCIQTYWVARFDGAVNVDYGRILLRGFLELPYVWGGAQNSADLLSYLGWRLYAGSFVTHTTTLFSEAVVSILLVGSLFVIQPTTTAMVVVTLGVIGGGVFFFVKSRIASLALQVRELVLKVNRVSMQSIQGLKDVKLFNNVVESEKYFVREQTSFVKKIALQRVFERITVWTLESVGFGGLVIGVLIMMFGTSMNSAAMMGTLSLLAVSAWRILPAMHRSVAVFGYIQGYAPFLVKMRELVDRIEAHDAVKNDTEVVELAPLSGEVCFEGVSYSYPNASKVAIDDLSLMLPKGRFVGIVGRSGAGKSTLADLLTGLLEPSAGRVSIDGCTLDKSTVHSWRKQVGFVPQAPYLFDGTLAENIAFTVDADRIDYERVASCCELAGLDEVWPIGERNLNLIIGERGSLLSGGQAQRVVIARALYKKPRLLIFDEATSALDGKTEQLVKDTVERLRENMTIVVIAHRLQTVSECDTIIWIENGRIVKSGNPGEILPEYERNEAGEY
jgi:ABC-type multidrug transport system fused ATPase/permease subunit